MAFEKGHYLYIKADTTVDYNTRDLTYCTLSVSSDLYIDNYDKVVNIVHTEYTPQIGDKLFFMPGVNIPRIKLKDLAIDYNIKTVRDPLEANVIFAGTNTAAKMTDSMWEYSIPTDLFKSFIEAADHILDDSDKEKMKLALEFYDKDFILTDWPTCSTLGDDTLDIYKQEIKNTGSRIRVSRESHRVFKIDPEYNALYYKIKDIELYSEGALLDKINGKDSVVIDSEVFEQISAMLQSNDNDNHVLAMEIMANCNYKESLLYLEILFKEYAYKFADCPAKNHVNFKSLLSYLNKDRTTMNTSIDEIMDSLISKNVLTEDKIEIILNRYGYEVTQHGNRKYFRVKTITLSEMALEIINSNYKFETLTDFIPKEVEITEEIIPAVEEEVKWT